MSINIDTSVKNQGQAPAIITGLDASKPIAGQLGRLYYATNTNIIYIDNGSTWIVFINGGGGGGTINVTSPFIPYASTTNNLVNSIIKQLAGNILINQALNNGFGILQVTGGINSDVFTAHNNLLGNEVFINPDLINFNSNGGDTNSEFNSTSLNIYDNTIDNNAILLATNIQFTDNGAPASSQLNVNDLTIRNDSNNEISKLTRYYLQIGPSGAGNANVSLVARSLTYSPVLGKSAYYNYDSLRLTDTTSLNQIDILPSSITLNYNLQNYFQSNLTSTNIKILNLGLLSTIPTVSINFALSIDSKVNRGNITLNSSLSPAAGLLCTLNYGTTYLTTPYTFVTETGNNNIPASYIIFSQSNSQCQIFFINRSTTSTIPSGQLKINYLTIF